MNAFTAGVIAVLITLSVVLTASMLFPSISAAQIVTMSAGSASEPALVQAGWPVLCPPGAEAGAKVAATSR